MTSYAQKILQTAQAKYDKGDRQGAINLLTGDDCNILSIFRGDDLAEAQKTIGLSLYYIAIKDFREMEDKKIETCAKAEMFLRSAIEITNNKDIRISAINFLPLVLWIQGKHDEALEVCSNATSEFSTVSSVWNTLSILYKWAKRYKESIAVCEMVFKTSIATNDFRTAGHGKHNQGDALKELGRTEEAKKAYKKAKELYLEFEKTSGQKATVHINGVSNKLASLIIVIALILCPVIRNIDNGVSSNDIFIEAPSFFV